MEGEGEEGVRSISVAIAGSLGNSWLLPGVNLGGWVTKKEEACETIVKKYLQILNIKEDMLW